MKKVLIVEDNAQNLYLVSFLMQKNGFEVIAARTGMEGLEMAKTEQPHLILMDLQLPEMDGYEATRLIKDNPATAHIPVIAVTSYAMGADRDKALASGCVAHIEKPIDPDTFIPIVMQYVRI